MTATLHLFAFDVAGGETRRRVWDRLFDAGATRVQRSVAWVWLDPGRLATLVADLDELIGPVDRVHWWPVCQRCRGLVGVSHTGQRPPTPPGAELWLA